MNCAVSKTRVTILGCVCLFALSGCGPSAFVRSTITNASGTPLQQLQMDYPSATFGKDKLPDNAAYTYRFKIQGSGKPHLQFVDAVGKSHSADGPPLSEGQEGTLDIRIDPTYSVSWQPDLRNK